MSLEIVLERVTKIYGEFIALRDVTGKIKTGDRLAILGHNGAGKSTLLNLLATLTRPTSGNIDYLWGERDLDAKGIRAYITYLAHEPMLYADLTALENLRFVARLYHRDDSDANLLSWLDQVGMLRAKDRLVRTCSRGMQQRISLARTILPEPEMLLLDEPFSGLDENGADRLREMLTVPDRSWVMITHDMHSALELANHLWVMRRGRVTHSLPRDAVDADALTQLCRGVEEAVPE